MYLVAPRQDILGVLAAQLREALDMATIIGLSGSLRQGSFTSLLRAAVALAPRGVELRARTIHGIPLYDADLEAAEGIPAAVQALKDEIATADGLLMVTPEYNNSMPGVFKNAVDWLSRPDSDIARVFRGLPVGLIGASPGPSALRSASRPGSRCCGRSAPTHGLPVG